MRKGGEVKSVREMQMDVMGVTESQVEINRQVVRRRGQKGGSGENMIKAWEAMNVGAWREKVVKA